MTPALARIDSTHYLCAYSGNGDDGWAVVLTVDTGDWTLSKETPFEFDTGKGMEPSLFQIDSTHYLCSYAGGGNDGWAVVLTVDTGDWTLSKETPFEFDVVLGRTPALSRITGTKYLCAYAGEGSDGWVTVLNIDSDTWEITHDAPFEYDESRGMEPSLAQIDSANFLCTYSGNGTDGWAVILLPGSGTGGIAP
jgi:hypothetical protein